MESWGEAVRSGDLTEALYETVTNAGQIMAAAIPGIGTVIGMGIATVGGIVKGIQEEQARIQEAVSSAISGAGDETIEAQGITDGEAYIRGVNQALQNAATERQTLQDYYGTDTFIEALQAAEQEAQDLGVPVQTVQDIITGTTEETAAAIANLQAQSAEYDAQIEKLESQTGLNEEQIIQRDSKLNQLRNEQAEVDGLIAQGETRLAQIEDEAASVDNVNSQINEGREAQRKKNAASAAAITVAETTAARVRDIASEVRNVPDLNIKTNVQRQELNQALEDARAGVEVPVTLRVKNQNAIQAAIGGSLAGDQSGLPRAGTGTG